jgi:hypothetical protein
MLAMAIDRSPRPCLASSLSTAQGEINRIQFLAPICAGLDRTIGSACNEPCSFEAQNGLLDVYEKRSCECWRTATSMQE